MDKELQDSILMFTPLEVVLNDRIGSGIEMVHQILAKDFDTVTSYKSSKPEDGRFLRLRIAGKVTPDVDSLETILNIFRDTYDLTKYKYVFLPYGNGLIIPAMVEMFPKGTKFFTWYHGTTWYPAETTWFHLMEHMCMKYNIVPIAASPSDKIYLNNRVFKHLPIDKLLVPYLIPESFNKYFLDSKDTPRYNDRIIMLGRLSDDRFSLPIIESFLSPEVPYKLDLYGANNLDREGHLKLNDILEKHSDKIVYHGYLSPEKTTEVLLHYKAIITTMNDTFGLATYQAARLGLSVLCPSLNTIQDGVDLYTSKQVNKITITCNDYDPALSCYERLLQSSSDRISSIDIQKNFKYSKQFTYEYFLSKLEELILSYH